MADLQVRSPAFLSSSNYIPCHCLANSERGTDFLIQSLQSASASPQQLCAFTEKRKRNLPMRTTTIVHFGQKACAWGGATSEATRRNEVFCLLPPRQGGTRFIQSFQHYEAVWVGKWNSNVNLARQEHLSSKRKSSSRIRYNQQHLPATVLPNIYPLMLDGYEASNKLQCDTPFGSDQELH